MNTKPWIKIAGLLIVVGVAAIVVNLAGKKAYELLSS